MLREDLAHGIGHVAVDNGQNALGGFGDGFSKLVREAPNGVTCGFDVESHAAA